MTPEHLRVLAGLHRVGCVLTVKPDGLHYSAPAGALTPALRKGLEGIRDPLLAEYQERRHIHLAAGMRPTQARRAAELDVGIRQRIEAPNPDRPAWAFDPDLDGIQRLPTPTVPGAVESEDLPATGAAGTGKEPRP